MFHRIADLCVCLLGGDGQLDINMLSTNRQIRYVGSGWVLLGWIVKLFKLHKGFIFGIKLANFEMFGYYCCMAQGFGFFVTNNPIKYEHARPLNAQF